MAHPVFKWMHWSTGVVLTSAFALIGVGNVASVMCRGVRWLYISFVARCNVRHAYRLQGTAGTASAAPWALVTGATDGIGRAFAMQLAKQGISLIVHGRSAEKLTNLVRTISEAYPNVATKQLLWDCSRSIGSMEGSKVLEEIVLSKDIDLAIVINNVGMSYEHPETMDDAAASMKVNGYIPIHQALIAINATFPVELTTRLLPMLRKRQGRVAIVNISSITAERPTPYLAVYSATKAFNRAMSVALATEMRESRRVISTPTSPCYRRHPFDVVTVCPGFVVTQLSKFRHPRFGIVSADELAKQTLNKLTHVQETRGHWQHDVVAFALRWIPDAYLFGFMHDIRQRALFVKAAKTIQE